MCGDYILVAETSVFHSNNIMKIYPAIDIKDGKCVRLRQGEASDATIYYQDPLDAAKLFAYVGSDRIHVVDLDGAFAGNLKNLEAVERIAALGMFVELGGGMRDADSVKRAINAGVSRAIVGTKACTHPELMIELLRIFGDKIAVGIDAKDGKVAIKGWVEVVDKQATELAVEMAKLGVKHLIYTDISTDGMLTGVNLEAQKNMRDIIAPYGMKLIASGGVASRDDIIKLHNLGGLEGAIVGKAIYENRVDLSDLIAITNSDKPAQ